MTELQFAAGDLVFAEGSPSTFVLRVTGGEAEVFKTVDGQAVPLGRVKPGEYIGEMGVIRDLPRNASVRAPKDLSAERSGRDDFLERVSQDSAMALRLLTRLSERLTVVDQAYARATLAMAAAGVEAAAAEERPAADEPAGPAPAKSLSLRAADPLLAAVLPGESLALKRLPFAVGRMPGPGEAAAVTPIDLLLDDSRPFRLSRAHFRIAEDLGGYRVQDLGSVLGTLVNGAPIGLHFGADAAPLWPGQNEVVAGGADSHFRFLLTIEAA